MRPLKIQERFTNKSALSTEKYLGELEKLKVPEGYDESQLAQLIRSGDETALHSLVKANLRFVVSVAKQYGAKHTELGDLINEGNLGMLKAARRYDETKGVKFISYAVWEIRQFISFFVNESSLVRVPRNEVDRKALIKKASRKLEQKLQREATADEIADAMSLKPENINHTLRSSMEPMSLDTIIGGENDSLRMIDTMPGDTNFHPDVPIASSGLKQILYQALSQLSERDRDIVLLYFGIGYWTNYSIADIAEKYDLSVSNTRVIYNKALMAVRKGPYAKELAVILSDTV